MLRIITTSGQELDTKPDNTIEFEVENPMFQTDYMPVMFSTSIELPPSDNNKTILGYLPALKMAPTVKTLNVSLVLDGIEISSGSLEYEGIQEDTGNLEYTFTEKSGNDSWGGKIADAREIYNTQLITVINPAGESVETGKGTFYNRYAIKIDALLGKIGNLEYEQVTGIDELYILTTGSNQSPYYDYCEALPDVTFAEFIDAIKKLFCMAIFKEGSKYVMKAISNILLASDYLDWSRKISDKFEAGRMKSKGYKLAYKNEKISVSEKAADAQSDGIISKTNMSGMITDISMGEYKAYEISQVGNDKYSITMGQVRLSSGDLVYKRYVDMIEHTGNERLRDGDEIVDNSPAFKLVECLPVEEFSGVYASTLKRNWMLYPRIDLSSGERGTDMYIGEIRDGQMIDKRVTFLNDGTDNTDGDTNLVSNNHDWSMNRVYIRYHSTYSNFLYKDKQTISADIKLNAQDLSAFRPWQKIFFASRYWLVSKLNFTLSPRRGIVSCRGEFVEI